MLGVHVQHRCGGKHLVQIHLAVVQQDDLVVLLVLQGLGQQGGW